MHQFEDEIHLGGTWVGGDPNSYSEPVFNRLIETYKPKSIIDIGCGEGYSSEFFKKKGLSVICVEGGKKAAQKCIEKELKTIIHDYTKGPYTPSETIDMAWCCEFVEHVEEKYMNNFFETFKMCKTLAITHAFHGQPGHHHVNCQPPQYWIRKIEAIGFSLNIYQTVLLRDLATEKAAHINRSLLIFEKQ